MRYNEIFHLQEEDFLYSWLKCKRGKIDPSKKTRFIVQINDVQGILSSSIVLMNLLQVSIRAPVLIQHTEPTYIPGILL